MLLDRTHSKQLLAAWKEKLQAHPEVVCKKGRGVADSNNGDDRGGRNLSGQCISLNRHIALHCSPLLPSLTPLLLFTSSLLVFTQFPRDQLALSLTLIQDTEGRFKVLLWWDTSEMFPIAQQERRRRNCWYSFWLLLPPARSPHRVLLSVSHYF